MDERNLHDPLKSTLGSAPQAFREHLYWLIICLYNYDKRFGVGVDLGINAPFSACVAPQVFATPSPDLPDVERGASRRLQLLRKKSRGLHYGHISIADFQQLQTTITLRKNDKKFGPLVLGDCSFLQKFDQILEIWGTPLVFPAHSMASAAYAKLVATFAPDSKRVAKMQPGLGWNPLLPKAAGSMLAVRFYRQPPESDTASKAKKKPRFKPPLSESAIARKAQATESQATEPEAKKRKKRAPAPTGSPPPPLVAVSLSQGAVQNAMLAKKVVREQREQGRSLWSPGEVARKTEALLDFVPGSPDFNKLSCAIATQETLLRVRASGTAIRAALAPPGASAQVQAAAALRALLVSLAAVQDVMYLHFHEGRLAEQGEQTRVRDRTVDLAVNHLVSFATPTPPSGAGPPASARPGVVVLGDWVLDMARAGKFAKKLFVKRLSRRLHVIIAGEYRTTARCGSCGAAVEHPTTQTDKIFKGTVYCSNKDCCCSRIFRNRDTAAARNIVARFVIGRFMGADLGCWATGSAKDAVRLSLTASLALPSAAGGPTASGPGP